MKAPVVVRSRLDSMLASTYPLFVTTQPSVTGNRSRWEKSAILESRNQIKQALRRYKRPRILLLNNPYLPCNMCSSIAELDRKSESDPDFESLAAEITTYLSSDFIPDEGPLSFDMLKRAGRTEIMSGIMKCGGSASVARRMGLDISLFVPPLESVQSKTFPDFNRPGSEASIALGQKLDDRLDSIRDIDPKSETPAKNRRKERRLQTDSVPSAEELAEQNRNIVPRVVDEVIPEGETLALSLQMRLTFVSIVVMVALGYGRTSHEILQPQVEETFKAVANGLVAANSALAIYVAFIMAPKLKRDPVVWLIKTLLAGAVSLKTLRGLGPLDKQ